MRVTRPLVPAALLSIVALSCPAAAAEAPREAELVPALAPILPTAKFSGTTTGEGSLKVSAELRFDVCQATSLMVAPTFSLSSNSAVTSWTTLDGQSTDTPSTPQAVPPESNAWKVGLLVGATVLGDVRDPRLFSVKFYKDSNSVLTAAVADCVRLCEHPGLVGPDKAFCDMYGKKGPNAPQLPSDYDPGELCSAGQQAYRAFETKLPEDQQRKQRDARFRFPKLDLSVWGGAGTSKFTYFGVVPGQTSTGPATAYTETSDTHWNAAGAIQAVYVAQGAAPFRFTAELPAALQYRWKPAKEIGQACVAAGTLTSNGTQILDCKSEALGAPSSTWVSSAGLYAGIVDSQHGAWRAAIGGTWSRDPRNNITSWTVSTPAYVSLVNFGKDSGFTPDVNGIIRVAPSLQVTRAPPKATDVRFFVVLELLAQRTLFSHADDLL